MINLADLVRHSYRARNSALLSRMIYLLQFAMFNSSVPVGVRMGVGSRFAYGGIGCVIHKDAVIGARVILGQGITIGGDGNRKGVPIVEDGAYLGAGCRLLGPITIGAGARIGANAVVLTDVPAGATAVGVPAQVIHVDRAKK